MNRRAFLKTIAAGAVAAVVPLPVPMYAVERWAAKHGGLNPHPGAQTELVQFYIGGHPVVRDRNGAWEYGEIKKPRDQVQQP